MNEIESSGHLSAAVRTIPRIHIVGRKNAGKTTLVCELLQEFRRLGCRVATIKHTHHDHELDTPGKDSHKHREAGAAAVGILSSRMTAIFVPTSDDEDRAARYARFDALFLDYDLILVEGDLHASAIRIEVWRDTVVEPPYAATDSTITAVVSDDWKSTETVVWPRNNVPQLAQRLQGLVFRSR